MRASRAVLITVLTSAAALAQEPAELRVGAVVRFELAEDAPRFGAPELAQWADAIPGRAFMLCPEESGPHTIVVRSGVCDSYVIVRNAAGNVVAETGAGPYGEHAWLHCDLEAGATYRVEACSFRDFGPMEVSVRAGRIEVPPGEAFAREAIGDQLATVAARRRAFGEVDPRVAGAYMQLGFLNFRYGQFRSALVAYRRALDVFEQLPDSTGMEGFVHAQIGAQLFELRELDAAEAEYREALRIAEIVDPDGQNVADALQGTSRVLKARDDYAGALPLDRRALAIIEGAGEPYYTAISRNNLALSLERTGSRREALALYEVAAATFAAMEGAEDQLAQCSSNSAELLVGFGRPRDAATRWEEATRLRIRFVGWRHPATIGYAGLAARLERRVGRVGIAEQLAVATLGALAIDPGAGSRLSAGWYGALAECAGDTDRGREARANFERIARKWMSEGRTQLPALAVARALVRDREFEAAAATLEDLRRADDGSREPVADWQIGLELARALDGVGEDRAAAEVLEELGSGEHPSAAQCLITLERARAAEGEDRVQLARLAAEVGDRTVLEQLEDGRRAAALDWMFQLRECVDEVVRSAADGRAAAAYDPVLVLGRAWHRWQAPDRLRAAPASSGVTVERLAAALPEGSAFVDVSVHVVEGTPHAFAWVVRAGDPSVSRVDLGVHADVRRALADGDVDRAALDRALADAGRVFVAFAEPFDGARLPVLLGLTRSARFVDRAGAITVSHDVDPAPGRVVVTGTGDRSKRAAAAWRGAGFDVAETAGLAAPEDPAVLHLVATLEPSPGPLGSAWVWAAAQDDQQRMSLDVHEAVELPLYFEARLTLADGTSVGAEQLGERDLSGCAIALLDLDGAPRGDGAAAVARALRFAGVGIVLIPPDGDPERFERFARALGSDRSAIEAAARAAGYDVLGGGR